MPRRPARSASCSISKPGFRTSSRLIPPASEWAASAPPTISGQTVAGQTLTEAHAQLDAHQATCAKALFRCAACVRADRGGDGTYRGPGQRGGYPIVSVPMGKAAIPAHVHTTEQLWIDVLADLGLPGASRLDGYPGVWIDDRKIAADASKLPQRVPSRSLWQGTYARYAPPLLLPAAAAAYAF